MTVCDAAAASADDELLPPDASNCKEPTVDSNRAMAPSAPESPVPGVNLINTRPYVPTIGSSFASSSLDVVVVVVVVVDDNDD